MSIPEIGAIAQLGERYNGIVEVSGSIPLGSTKTKKGSAVKSAELFFYCGSEWVVCRPSFLGEGRQSPED